MKFWYKVYQGSALTTLCINLELGFLNACNAKRCFISTPPPPPTSSTIRCRRCLKFCRKILIFIFTVLWTLFVLTFVFAFMFRFVYVIKITNFNPPSLPLSPPCVRLFSSISVFLHFLFRTKLARHHGTRVESSARYGLQHRKNMAISRRR
jgi:hypothetical protein